MESKYNLLTRLLKNIKNVVNPDGSIAGSGGGVLVVHETQHQGETFVSGTLPNVDGYAFRSNDAGGVTYYYVDVSVDLEDIVIESVSVSIGDSIYPGFSSAVTYANGTLTVRVGSIVLGRTSGYTSESELQGLNITVYTLLTVLDKTWQEIHDSDFAVLKLSEDEDSIRFANVIQVGANEGSHGVAFVFAGATSKPFIYMTDSPDGYPVLAVLPDGPDQSTPKE